MQGTTNSAQYAKLVARLPVTFRPFVNQELVNWGKHFSFERKSIENLLSYLGRLNEREFELLFKPVHTVETKMGVERWAFPTQGQTLESTSLLAHSPYFQEWRKAVQEVFDEVAKRPQPPVSELAPNRKHRLILIVIPRILPVNRETVWKEWSGQGRELAIAEGDSRSGQSCSEVLLGGAGSGLLSRVASTTGHVAEDLWLLDADTVLRQVLPTAGISKENIQLATYLSYTELKTFREAIRDRLNWIQKDLADADAVIASLRQIDVVPWCPQALKGQLSTREFVRELFLSGNGSVVFSNSFVQWAASEALRRARPRMLVARFGTRNKPKPFTSLAILEDQEGASPLPDAPDPDGSSIDAQILARYIWLAASRYEEYRDAVCLCVADALPAIYAIAPAEHSLLRESEPMTLERIRSILEEWIS